MAPKLTEALKHLGIKFEHKKEETEVLRYPGGFRDALGGFLIKCDDEYPDDALVIRDKKTGEIQVLTNETPPYSAENAKNFTP